MDRQRVRVGGNDVVQPLDVCSPWVVRGRQGLLNELDVGVLPIEAELGQKGVLARVAVVERGDADPAGARPRKWGRPGWR